MTESMTLSTMLGTGQGTHPWPSLNNRGKEVPTMSTSILTQARLRELLDYDSGTGIFIWRIGSKGAKAGSIAGCICDHGYMRISINNRRYYAHRLAWLHETGEWPEYEIDHIDGNPGNNRFENLRAVTRQENMRNQKRRITNTSGVMGASWDKFYQKWHARIMVNGKNVHLGYFENFDDAVAARKQAEADFGFHESHGRS